jgi:hypothetical protein
LALKSGGRLVGGYPWLRRGLCFRCGREIGGFLRPQAWRCVACLHLYCEGCAKKKVGVIFKKPTCPECKIELRDG